MANYLLVKTEKDQSFLLDLAIHMHKRNHQIVLFFIDKNEAEANSKEIETLRKEGISIIIDEKGDKLYEYVSNWADKILWL